MYITLLRRISKKSQPRLLTKGEHRFLEIIETGYLTRNKVYSLRHDKYNRDGTRTFAFVPEIFDTFDFINEDKMYSVENMLTWNCSDPK